MKTKLFGILAFAASLVVVSSPAVAHHGAATFDTGKEITLKGSVTEWIWANPHCFLKFDAKDDSGNVRSWAVETQNPVSMTSRGWSRNSFKFGDVVTVTLEPVKNGAPVGRILHVILPSGEKLIAATAQSAP